MTDKSRLLLNPGIEMAVQECAGKVERFSLGIPVRGRRIKRVVEVSSQSNPAFFQFLLRGTDAGNHWGRNNFKRQKYFRKNKAFLEKIGFLVSENQISLEAIFKPFLFNRRNSENLVEAELVVNPRIYFQTRVTKPPVALKGRLRGLARVPFAEPRHLLWLETPRDHLLCPYIIREEDRPLIRKLIDGDLGCQSLDSKQIDLLLRCGLLLPRRDLYRSRSVEERKCFSKLRYVVVRNLFPETLLDSLSEYYRARIYEGFGTYAKRKKRISFHNDPVARFFHFQLYPAMQRIIARPVKPSYCFVSFYAPGAVLFEHTDREQCEYTISVAISESPQGRAPWPLYIRTKKSQVEIILKAGDGVLFKGRELPHWRDKLMEGSALQILFHFVHKDFKRHLY
jgi:hypothetical protein